MHARHSSELCNLVFPFSSLYTAVYLLQTDNVGLFVIWAVGGKLTLGLQLAALAQGLMIVGANVGLAGFLAMAIADRR